MSDIGCIVLGTEIKKMDEFFVGETYLHEIEQAFRL